MTKPILLAAISAGLLSALPMNGQESPAPAPASTETPAAKSVTPQELAAIKSFLQKASFAPVRIMADMTPEEIQEFSTNKTSKPALRVSKALFEIPLDPNLPQFWKDSHAKGKALTAELVSAVESNASADKINELTKKIEQLNTESMEAIKQHGIDLDGITKELQAKAQTLMNQVSQKVMSDPANAGKDMQSLMKMIFTEVADTLEKESAAGK